MASSEPTSQSASAPSPLRAEPLTEIERKILDFMVQYLRANTYQPSIREIGRRFDIKSTKTVSEHLQALALKGFLERDSSRSRGVRILGVDLTPTVVSLPCLDAAPRDASELDGGEAPRIALDPRLGAREGGFLLRVGTEAPAELRADEGDLVVVAPLPPDGWEDGRVVLADTGSGTPFHRVARSGRSVTLEPLAPDAAPIVLDDPARLRVLGYVSGIFRRMEGAAAPGHLTRH